MPKRDEHLLVEDIYEAASKIERYTQGYSFEDFGISLKTVWNIVEVNLPVLL